MSTDESLSNDATTLPPLALIAGPTASGKSDCAVRLALALQARGKEAVIINADSAQVYADLAILSARPTNEEMRGIEHRLFGAWDGATACSAPDWAAAAKTEIAGIHARGAIPILVGGTGLYIRTLLDGIAPVPPIDPAIRQQVRAMTVRAARAALAAADPERAALLSPADGARIARALEVTLSTGRTLAQWQEERSGGIGTEVALHPLLLLPPREWLYERCDRRFALMLEQGAVEEVRALLARDLAPDLPVMRAIGVRDIAHWLAGEQSHEEVVARGAQATRNYGKRQYTWFRGQSPAEWPRDNSTSASLEAYFETLLQ